MVEIGNGPEFHMLEGGLWKYRDRCGVSSDPIKEELLIKAHGFPYKWYKLYECGILDSESME